MLTTYDKCITYTFAQNVATLVIFGLESN